MNQRKKRAHLNTVITILFSSLTAASILRQRWNKYVFYIYPVKRIIELISLNSNNILKIEILLL